jgi:hypothetical protein
MGKPCEIKGLNSQFPLRRHVKQSSQRRPWLDVHLPKMRAAGFDSVYAVRGTRDQGGVQYDEMIVYSPDQALPRFIVHFGGHGAGQAVPRAMAPAGRKTELKPPGERAATSANEQFLRNHWNTALAQFYQMGGVGKISQVDYFGYEQSQMQQDFDNTRARFERKRVGGVTWIFHGTGNEGNITSIMMGGFKVAGRDGIPIANGAALGRGVYSATTPATPMQYGQGTQSVILAMALPGTPGGQEASDSWGPGDWHVFATKEQVLPCYVVRFG